MKKIMSILAICLAILGSAVQAQDSTHHHANTGLLTHYYQLSEALVAGNAGEASTHATAFIKAANATDDKLISGGNIAVLVKDASNIAGSKDISKQREHFMNFSRHMTAVAKSGEVVR